MNLMTREQLSEKVMAQMEHNLKLSDEEITVAIVATGVAFSAGHYVHVFFPGGDELPQVYEMHSAKEFARHVAGVDEDLIAGLRLYETAGMKKYALYSSPHASILWALPG
jgi:hypothetical protein